MEHLQRFNSSIVTASPRQDSETHRQRAATFHNSGAPSPSFKLERQAGKHDGVADMKEELEEHFNMGEWEFVGPQGSYAESVFRAKTWESEEEVAIKVVSLQNQSLQDCK